MKPNTNPTVANEIATGTPIINMTKNPPNIKKATISGLNMLTPTIGRPIEINPNRFCNPLKSE